MSAPERHGAAAALHSACVSRGTQSASQRYCSLRGVMSAPERHGAGAALHSACVSRGRQLVMKRWKNSNRDASQSSRQPVALLTSCEMARHSPAVLPATLCACYNTVLGVLQQRHGVSTCLVSSVSSIKQKSTACDSCYSRDTASRPAGPARCHVSCTAQDAAATQACVSGERGAPWQSTQPRTLHRQSAKVKRKVHTAAVNRRADRCSLSMTGVFSSIYLRAAL